jgi:predicted nucleic acid-binding protein
LHQLDFYYCCMKQRIYLDTSVIGGVFDQKFEEITNKLFNLLKLNQIIVVLSDLTENEIKLAPLRVSNFFYSLGGYNIEFINGTDESSLLANSYLNEKVVGPNSYDDCHHIALATISKVNILASWNFKHIVNENRIRGYNSVNLKLGYSQIKILSPLEIINL